MSQKAALAIGMRAAAESSEIDFLEFDPPDAKKYVSHNKRVKRILNEFTKIRESGISPEDPISLEGYDSEANTHLGSDDEAGVMKEEGKKS